MGKLLITNSPEWDGMLRKLFADSGFRESAHVDCNDARVTAYKKLCVDNCNFYSCGEDFVACAGTLIYRENFGEDALRMLYEDSRSMNVTELRKNLIGSYVVAVKNGDVIRIFVDETHIYKFYYYADGGKYILTSTFYHVEKCAKQPLHDDAFLEKMTRTCTMSRQTIYQNVYKVCAREYFMINLADNSCSVEECPLNDYHCKFASREEALDTLFERLKYLSSLRSKFIRSHRIFLTGGLDSRLEYATHLYNHDDVRPAYWFSSYEKCITNGTPNDWEIVRKLADMGGGVSAELFDVTEPIEETFGYDVHEVSNKYGEYAAVYALNKKWLSLLESTDTEGLTFGYFSYVMNMLHDLPEINTFNNAPYSLRDLICNIWYKNIFDKSIFYTDTIYDYIESELLPLTEGMNTADLTRDDIYRLFTYSRFETSARLGNFSNMFVYEIPIFAQKYFADANFSIPYEWREGGYFSLSLTKLFCPKLLEIPYFSNHHFLLYDPATNTVRDDTKSSTRNKIASAAPGLFKLLRRIYINVMSMFGSVEDEKRKNEKKILRLSAEIIKNSKTVTRSKLKFSDEAENGRLPKIAAACKIADTLIDD